MNPGRLAAFSDGVLAIIITIMVLEISAPAGHDIADWEPLLPVILAYVFSFAFIAIYWNNHHHLLRATGHITPRVMWSNMSLLLFLSLIPVATSWLGEGRNYLEAWPIAVYSMVSLAAGVSFYALTKGIMKADPGNQAVAQFDKSPKGLASQALYVAAIVVAFLAPAVSLGIMVITQAIWFIPDRRLAPG
ncbi:MAG: DUF1211 domain-containing protein [Acidimicrobiia bacterium]|nr:DUF1211 domain-containing protein [Acidimicrobiia bacterium]